MDNKLPIFYLGEGQASKTSNEKGWRLCRVLKFFNFLDLIVVMVIYADGCDNNQGRDGNENNIIISNINIIFRALKSARKLPTIS